MGLLASLRSLKNDKVVMKAFRASRTGARYSPILTRVSIYYFAVIKRLIHKKLYERRMSIQVGMMRGALCFDMKLSVKRETRRAASSKKQRFIQKEMEVGYKV